MGTSIPDGPDADEVQPSDWDADHVVPPGTIVPQSPIFGSGADGDLVFDGVATVLGLAPASVGGVLVYTLTRDIFADHMVVGGGVAISAVNWRVFCRTSLTGGGSTSSSIHCNGPSAPAAIAGGGIVN